ncbi:restriction endonuclease subunit S [Rhizobium sp. AN80A]|uniref:restriction endonuclease subunit S n=1 Tax=Rhizobium sp. AN80A TaxID=3040673 RepID=UPI0024B32761|nr:restriction endonuclease subunit S [Rhizobium sp. AN80A]
MINWRDFVLGDVVKFKGGSVFPKEAQGLAFGDLPFVKVSDMNRAENWKDLYGAENWLSVSAAKALKATIHEPGAVAFAKIGVALTYNRRRRVIRPTLLDNNMMSASTISKDLNQSFLYHLLQTIDFNTVSAGSALPYLTVGTLNKISVRLPPPEQQMGISSLLDHLDEKIELNRQMNETLELMAQAIFRDWFVDFGPTRRKLEGATDPLTIMGGLVQGTERAQALADLFPAALGDDGLPEGWESKPLLDQANWVNGAAYKNMHFSDDLDALPVVKIAELKNGVTTSTKRTNTALGERYRISDGELLFSWSGNPDTSIDAFVWIGGDAWLNQHIFAVRENGTRSRAALYVLLKALMPQFAELARNRQTTGLGHVTKEDMKRLEIAVAPGPVEAAFEDVITPIFDLIVGKLFENRTLAATRDLLLPELMSGEVRLTAAS